MTNDSTSATSQPAEAPQAPTANSDAPKSNLTVAQAAQRLLNMEAENAKAQAATAEQTTQASPEENSANPEAAQAESAPDGESQSDAQAEGKGEPEGDVHSQDYPPELKNKIDKRIGKEVAKRKALEAKVNELTLAMQQQGQVSQEQQPVPLTPLPQGTAPLAQIENIADLGKLHQQAKEAKRFAQEQLDRDDFEPFRMGETVVNRDALKTILRNAEKTLEDDIPARAQFLQTKNQAQQVAFEKFPFLRDKSAPEYVQAQQAYMAMPWLRNLPNADWIIGVQIEGLKALEAKEKRSKTSTKPNISVSKTPPPAQALVSSSGSDNRAPSQTKTQSQLEGMRSAMSKSGGVTANQAAQFLLARELSKSNR